MDVGFSQNVGSDPDLFHGIEKSFRIRSEKKREKYKRDGVVYKKTASKRRRILPDDKNRGKSGRKALEIFVPVCFSGGRTKKSATTGSRLNTRLF